MQNKNLFTQVHNLHLHLLHDLITKKNNAISL